MYTLTQRINMAQAKAQSYKIAGDTKRANQYQAYADSLKARPAALTGYTVDGMAVYSNVCIH